MKKKLNSNSPLDAATCSPSSDTTETLAAWKRFEKDGQIIELLKHAIAMERGRNEWKSNHDNQVELKRIIAARPDLAERAQMVEKLMKEKQQAELLNVALTTGSAFDRWCRHLGWQVIKTAMEAMEKDTKPSDKDLADIVRNACNDYVSDNVVLDMPNAKGDAPL